VGKYFRAGREVDHSLTLRRKDVLGMPDNDGKNRDAHLEYVILTAFP